jgi:Xaa-Pro aminopeptidase
MRVRGDRLTTALPDVGIDILLVTNLANVRYLTGYSGSNGVALVGPDTRTFITDFRYVEQAAEEVDASFERRQAPQDLLAAVQDVLPGGGAVRLGFEEGHVTVRTHNRLRELLDDRIELVGADGLVERLRAVKDANEVAAIRAACQLADAALDQVLSDGLVGRTERDVALALEMAMRELGAKRPSFDTIVAAGPHGALPHAQPRDVVIEPDQLVVIDWGAELDGYCSDCTRTVATGQVSDHAEEIYGLVRSAQLSGLEGVAAGRNGRDVDAVARRVIEDAGHGDHYGHGLGHGVGIEIHEAPRLSQRSEDTLVAGNIVSVEPGVYLPGELGVRIEDLVVVTDTGCEILTGLTKDLRVIS